VSPYFTSRSPKKGGRDASEASVLPAGGGQAERKSPEQGQRPARTGPPKDSATQVERSEKSRTF